MREAIDALKKEQVKLMELKQSLSAKKSLNTEEGMMYARVLVKLVMLDMQIKELETKKEVHP